MENIQESLNKLKATLSSSSKEKIIGVSTTADKSNPEIIFGSIRETRSTISGTVILRDIGFLKEIIGCFDGVVDYFMLDPEYKNEVSNLETTVTNLIKKSKIFIYKPNDFTVDSLDMFVALLFKSLQGKKVYIIGAGNIGSKIALKLCERGAHVSMYDNDISKIQIIVGGLNYIKRSSTQIEVALNLSDGAQGADLIIGCTPGIPVITKEIITVLNKGSKIIDAGNRTVFLDAIVEARVKGIEILSLSSLPGYIGMIENWLFQRELLQNKRIETVDGCSIIVPGVLGLKGDILVDNISKPTRIFGVCDGVGGLLSREEGMGFLGEYIAKNSIPSSIQGIVSLY